MACAWSAQGRGRHRIQRRNEREKREGGQGTERDRARKREGGREREVGVERTVDSCDKERHTHRQTHHIAVNRIMGDLLLSFHVPHTHLHRNAHTPAHTTTPNLPRRTQERQACICGSGRERKSTGMPGIQAHGMASQDSSTVFAHAWAQAKQSGVPSTRRRAIIAQARVPSTRRRER
jgi:hypothetical protein